jgi:hypothetical protein
LLQCALPEDGHRCFPRATVNAFVFALDAVKHWEGARRTPEAPVRAYRKVISMPRFGFAYDLTGKLNSVVRGGGGLFYDPPDGNTVF